MRQRPSSSAHNSPSRDRSRAASRPACVAIGLRVALCAYGSRPGRDRGSPPVGRRALVRIGHGGGPSASSGLSPARGQVEAPAEPPRQTPRPAADPPGADRSCRRELPVRLVGGRTPLLRSGAWPASTLQWGAMTGPGSAGAWVLVVIVVWSPHRNREQLPHARQPRLSHPPTRRAAAHAAAELRPARPAVPPLPPTLVLASVPRLVPPQGATARRGGPRAGLWISSVRNPQRPVPIVGAMASSSPNGGRGLTRRENVGATSQKTPGPPVGLIPGGQSPLSRCPGGEILHDPCVTLIVPDQTLTVPGGALATRCGARPCGGVGCNGQSGPGAAGWALDGGRHVPRGAVGDHCAAC